MPKKAIDPLGQRERIGMSIDSLLRSQFERLGGGGLPFAPPFSTPKARGALLGTAITVVDLELGYQPTYEALLDAAVMAFSLAFGSAIGERAARQTIAEAGAGDREVIDASDRAANGIRALTEASKPITSDAYYLAVTGNL